MVLETELLTLPGAGFVLGLRRALDGDHLAVVSTGLALGIRIPDKFELIPASTGSVVAKGGKRRGTLLFGNFQQSVVVQAPKPA